MEKDRVKKYKENVERLLKNYYYYLIVLDKNMIIKM